MLSLFFQRFCLACNHSLAKHSNEKICQNCQNKIEDLIYCGCARCGNVSCSGFCEELNFATTVSTQFLYQHPLDHIIRNAKQRNCKISQEILNEIIVRFTVPLIKNIIVNKQIKLIVFPAFRKKIFFDGVWHPNVMIYHHIKYMLLREKLNVKIVIPYSKNFKQKNAFISSRERKLKKEENCDYLDEYFNIEDKKLIDDLENEFQMLIVDDILTSGQTVIKTYRLLQNTISCHYETHIFSIFKSPVFNNL